MEFPGQSTESAEPGRPYLALMPRELLFIVADQLPTASRTTLALACKSLFISLCPTGRFPELDNGDLLAVLLMLEKDAPNIYLCFGCTRLRPLERNRDGSLREQLHPRCESVLRTILSFRDERRPPATRIGRGHWRRNPQIKWVKTSSLVVWRPAVLGLGGNVPEITFTEAHLVMNRHFYGAAHGLPIQHFESGFEFDRHITLGEGNISMNHFPLENHHSSSRKHDLRPTRPPPSQSATRWPFSHRTSAKIIDDALFLCRRHRVTAPPCSMADFCRVVDSLELPVCRDIYGSSQMPSLHFWVEGSETCIPKLLALRTGVTEPETDVHPDAAVRSCSHCFTDYEISVNRGRLPDEEWRLELVTYHKLGSCRTPEDPVWSALVEGLCRYPYDSRAGEARRAWLGGAGDTAASYGTWILRSATKMPKGHQDEESKWKPDARASLTPRWDLGLQPMLVDRYFTRSDKQYHSYRTLYQRYLDGAWGFERPGSVMYHGPKASGKLLLPEDILDTSVQGDT
ncbi:hypothetical protein CMUS01_13934 [Colletotrichum musicola]|uniref:F-box domain-containing protein n=1 Tax=Colletotrichum musicola TaxID=2175873 RepID=A0A8H6MT88_9PEZI|nr:hypothetical protein CMUS01_13934 [Colletotrichum musicola]